MPWSIFTGRRGQPEPGEPVWTSEDQAIALVWQAERNARCGGCGEPVAESMARENRHAYEAEIYVCHACAARDAAMADQAESEVKEHGLKFGVTRRTEVTGA